MTQTLVLCYHAVSDAWNAPLSVTQDHLRQQLTKLVSRGWVGTTFADAMEPRHPRTLAVTFDDGFDSVRSLAAPVLAELGLPGTVFVATDWVGQSLSWPEVAGWASTTSAHELRSMSWDSLRDLAAAGWEIGSHTCSHPHLSRLSSEAILAELRDSRTICEQMMGVTCRSVAYPFGDADDRVRAAAAAAGYEAAAGLSAAAFVARDRFDWPRVGVWHGEPNWRFNIKVLPVTSWLRHQRAGSVLLGVHERMRARRRAALARGPGGVSAVSPSGPAAPPEGSSGRPVASVGGRT